MSKRQDEEISIGDFVLTGGEIPAMAVADAVCRMVPGVLPDEEAFTAESHWDGPVSYTHLDVYKRQMLDHMQRTNIWSAQRLVSMNGRPNIL